MKKLFALSLTCLLGAGILFSQGFEGMMEFKKKTAFDTVSYTYFVKGDKVRIDEVGAKSAKVEGSFIIDLKAGTMLSLSHDRKMYLEQKSPAPTKPGGECKIEKTKNSKQILGYKCVEWKVTNATENTIVSYWVTSGKFNFFGKMLNVLNRKDKFSVYYAQLKAPDGSFPLLAVMSPMDGKESERLETTKVEPKKVDAKNFMIPAGYTKFDK